VITILRPYLSCRSSPDAIAVRIVEGVNAPANSGKRRTSAIRMGASSCTAAAGAGGGGIGLPSCSSSSARRVCSMCSSGSMPPLIDVIFMPTSA